MSCNLCDLGANSLSQLRPVGSNNPDVYIVLDKPTDDELRFGDLTTGVRGQYLTNALMSVGLTNYRMFSIIRCGCDRNPTPEEISQCLKFIESDIYRTNPKVIITAGALATQSLLGITDKITNVRGLVRNYEVKGKKFQVVPTYSPTYVINKYNNSEVVGEFMGDLATASKIVTGEYLNPMDRNVLEYALDYDTFYNFYETNLKGEEMLAYDIETNAKLVYSKDFDICGWSLAKVGIGIYVCLDALDYHMSEPDRQQCIDLLVKILQDTPKIVVHNSLYERPATYFRYGYELPFEKVEDTLVMAKIMLGGKVGAGLKPNARRIGYPEWDKDLAQYIDGFTKAIKRSSLKRFQPIIQELRNGATFNNVFEKLNDKKYDEIQEFYNKGIKESTLRYYTEDEFEQLVPEISRKFVEGYDNGFTQVIPYSWVPQRMLCKYGATDSLATFDLYNYFMRRFDEDSTDEVDLHKGYYYDLMEHNTGYELMLAGIHWDDDSATRDYKVYSDMMLKSLRAMILCNHPAMNEFILRRFIPTLAPPYIYENYNDYFWEHYKNRIEMKDESTYVMVDISPTTGKERRRDTKFFFNDTDQIPDSIKNDLLKKILPEAKSIIDKMDMDELKGIFNPASTLKVINDTYNNIVLDDDLRVGNFINKLRDNILKSEEIDRSKYPEDERQLLDYIEKYLEVPVDEVDNRKSLYEPLKSYILSLTRMTSKDMQEYLGDMHNFRLDGLSEGSQLEVFESLRTTPMNIDDPSTWTDPFKWNFYLRMYKKSSKVITAYLDGSVGRGSVYAVNKAKLQSGDDVVYREEPMTELGTTNHKGNLPQGDDWLEQSNFGVGTAETGRWRCLSGDTLVPLLDGRILTIKEIYDNDIKDFYVYSYDQTTNKIVPGYCKYAHITGHNAEMIEVLLDTGEVIKCTKNHKIVMRNGHKKMAGDLVPGDSLMPLNRRINDEGYELLQQPNGDWELTHRVVMSDKMGSDYSSQARGRHQCHHKDTDKLNNDPRNLAWITEKTHRSEHLRIHYKRMNEDHEYRDQYLPRMQASAKNMIEKREQNPEYRAKICEHNKNLWHEIWTAPEWEEWRECQREVSRQSMKKLTDAQHNPNNPDYHKYDEWREKNKVQASNLNLVRAYNLARDFYEDNGYIDENGYESVRKRGFMTWTTLTNTLGGVDELVRMIENHERINHQVVAIRDAGVEGTVYDLTVEHYHTFCISAGRRAEIFVGNSSIHVLPAGSTVKRLMTSRYPGGTIFQPDFSANELRCVASLAHEESMLQAFRDGIDIHKSNASRVFGVPPEEITPFQRRWAKTLSFQVLYGGGVHSVAQNYFNGDMKRAQEALDAFYGAFPGLSAWLESKHDEVLKTHKVSTMTQRFINIDFDPNDQQSKARALRASGNYPVQSFDYDTEITGLDGRSHKIGELADNHEDLWVYTYDTENHRIIPMKGIQAQCTGTTDTWYEIILDNGESVKVTPEHKMMLRDGTYCRADELQVGQSLMPLYLSRDERDSSFTFGRLQLNDEAVQYWSHDSVYNNVPNTAVHHININPDDNRPENLLRLSNSSHIAYHRNFYEYLLGTKSLDEFIEIIKPEIIRNYPDRYKERIEDIKRLISEIPEERKEELAKRSMTYRNKHKSESWDKNQREAVSREVYKRLEESGNVLGMDSEEYKKRLSESWAETRDYRVQRLKEAHNSPETKKRHSESTKKLTKDPEFIFKNQLKDILGYMMENNLPWSTPEEWDTSIVGYPKKSRKRYSKFILGKMTWDEFLVRAKNYASTYNHKIVDIKVIHLEEPEPKYDLHVPKYHNFALSCGVFTHNSASSTMAAVIFCDILLYMKKHNMKSKGICFIHDSLESDIYPYELIELTKYQQKELATGAIDYFGIECKADVSMGYSMGHECEMTDIEVLDDNYTKAYITLEGFYNDILDTLNHWKLAYHKVEIVEEDLHDQYLSVSEMFIARKAFDPTAMNHHQQGKVKIYIQYYNDNGEIEPMSDHFEPINIWENAPVYKYVESLNY